MGERARRMLPHGEPWQILDTVEFVDNDLEKMSNEGQNVGCDYDGTGTMSATMVLSNA